MNLENLRKIETKTIRGERNFELKTALMKIFKALSWLFDGRKDVPEKEIAEAAKRQSERLGLDDRYNWNEIFGLVNQNVEQQLNGNPYPNNFGVVEAIANGSCFFDSFRQSLEQQKGIKVTVEQLREVCQKFARENPPEWFIHKVGNDWDEVRGEFVNRGITSAQYVNSIEDNTFWGRPDIEGRILCEKYGVKLYVIESNPLRAIDNQQDPFLHQLIDSRGSRSTGEYSRVDYNSDSVLHIINNGGLHFEPLLDRNKSLTKQPQRQTQEQMERQAQVISSFMIDASQEHLTKQHQEQKDRELAEKLQQEESDRQLAIKLQKQEISSFMKNAFMMEII